MANPSKPQELDYERVDREEMVALKALQAGEANPGQQALALRVIVNKFCRPHDVTYIPGRPDGSHVLIGRAFVGQCILKYLKIPVGKLDEMDYFNRVEEQPKTNPHLKPHEQ